MEINRTIDHTLLKADTSREQIKTLCEEAKKYQFYSVCINPHYASYASELLEGSNVKICTVIGFPLGMNTTEIKIEETKRAIVDGASEVDMVINIGELKSRNQKFLVNEISQIATLCHANNVLLKVIIETALLNQEEKILACKVVSQSKADFIKTSTGFSTSGAKLEDIKLLKKNIDTSVRVKASGGIKDLKTAMEMLEAGASRLGTSSGVAICENKKSNQEY